MGTLGEPFALISMSNGDVYYMDEATHANFLLTLTDKPIPEYSTFTDAKSGKGTLIATSQISSIVTLETNKGDKGGSDGTN